MPPALLDPEALLVRPGRELPGPGAWDAVFGRRAPLLVEVGFGRDDGLLRRARAAPDRDFLGVELKRDRVRTYLGRAARAGLRNLRVVPGRAEVVVGILLPAGRVAGMRIECPDPWPKDRHAGHRLVRPFFVREVRRVLEPGGWLLLSTDVTAYAEQMRAAVESVGGWEAVPVEGAAERNGGDDPTIFESKGLAQGRPIRRLRFRRLP